MEKLRNQINEYCEKNSIFGMIRVTVRDEIRFEHSVGFADKENGVLFSKDSMFSLYSLSKPFCAIGLLKLKDKGLVDLDAHPSKYLPEAAGFDEAVTIRQILHHTSGLPDFAQNKEFAAQYAPGYAKFAREHLKILTGYPQYFAPGTDGKYINTNFIICALIIENVSNMKYADYMRKEIFEPLGMKNAIVDDKDMIIPKRVKAYMLLNDQFTLVSKCDDWLFGAGDIVATVDDVYCLNRAIKHRLILNEETWREALTHSPLNSKGMGCTVTSWHGKHRITHNGGHMGFRTLHIQLPEDDFDIIFLSNTGHGNARDDLSEMIYTAFYGKDNVLDAAVEMDTGYIK